MTGHIVLVQRNVEMTRIGKTKLTLVKRRKERMLERSKVETFKEIFITGRDSSTE